MLRVRDEEFFLHERTENRMHRRYSDDYNDAEMELYSQYKDQNMVIQWQNSSSYSESVIKASLLFLTALGALDNCFELAVLSLLCSHGAVRMKMVQFTVPPSVRKL